MYFKLQSNWSLFIICLLFLSLSSCKSDSILGIDESNYFITDDYGRVLILHGLNTSSSAKSDSLRNPWIEESDVEREASEFGFNFVRYLIFWDAIEPEKNVFDDEYIDRVQERIEWYTNRNMYVMLDMHQDIYSAVFGGDGAPLWAVRSNGYKREPLDGDMPWWLQNINPAVMHSYQNFFLYDEGRHQDLQDQYIKSWLKIVERFKNNPYVLGYDLMNEPHAGDLLITLSPKFEAHQLQNFYDRLIKAIRTVDNEKWIIFEPRSLAVNFGSASFLKKVNDYRVGERKLIYSPHCYPLLLHEGVPFQALDTINMLEWEKHRRVDLAEQKTGMIIGEFGVSPQTQGYDAYLDYFFKLSDNLLASWAYWSNDKGGWSPLNADRTETPILNHLIRPYARAIAGTPLKMSYDRNTKIFELEFEPNQSITQPTEIFIPNRHYPDGYILTVSGTNDFTADEKNDEQLILLNVRSNQETVNVTVSPK
jgi:endoglycosylceramidase